MKCALVWRNGYAELRVVQCNADEHEYLKKQIGKSIEVEIRPTPRALDACPVCLGSGVRVTKITGVQTKCRSCRGTGQRR